MLPKKNEKIINNYDLTVFIPILGDLFIFNKILLKNIKHFQNNGIEVIILINHKDVNVAHNLLKKYYFINWKLITVYEIGSSNLFSNILQIGIKYSVKKFFMLIPPYCKLQNHWLYIFRMYAEYYLKSIIYADYYSDTINNFSVHDCLIFNKNTLQNKHLSLNAFNYEQFLDKFFLICSTNGINKIYLPEINSNKKILKDYKKFLLDGSNSVCVSSQEIIQKSKYKIIKDWQNKFEKNAFQKFSIKFHEYKIQSSNIFRKKYKIVALVQTYNEEHNIKDLLKNIDHICDGVILLDDGSSDRTFELAESNKILIKVRKKRRGFNDLGNRNTLLEIVNFLNVEWLFFIDADERFDPRYCNLKKYAEHSNSNVLGFYIANMWDKPEHFRKDILEPGNIYSREGMLFRLRMFKNIGNMRINANRKLHFSSVPYYDKPETPKILVKHFGLYSKSARIKKYNFYKKQDAMFDTNNNSGMYDLLLDEKPILENIKNIKL